MYVQDRDRSKTRYYSAPELDEACAKYFQQCDEQDPPRRPTLPGLLLYLGMDGKDWRQIEAGEGGYSRHSRVAKKALLEIRDRLEQRTDTAAIFLLKQKAYGGYTDRPEPDSAGGIHIKVTFGDDKGKTKGNSTK